MFLSYIPPIDIQYSRLNFITMNKKYNLWTDSLIVIVYIILECVVSIKVMFMIDYITISLAVIVCLVMWWSFLAISGLKRSCPNRLTAHSGTQKNEAPKLFDWISYIYFHAHFIKLISRLPGRNLCPKEWFGLRVDEIGLMALYLQVWPQDAERTATGRGLYAALCVLACRSQLFSRSSILYMKYF